MNPPSAIKQLEILNEATARIQKEGSEEVRVHAICDALEALGLKRFRVAIQIRQENVIALKYARGNYGSLPIRNLTYQPHGLTAWVFQQKQPVVVGDLERPVEKWRIYAGSRSIPRIQSIMALPIFNDGDVGSVLTVDSTEKRGFSEKWFTALRPYQCLLGLVLSRAAFTIPSDPDLTKTINQSRKIRVLILGKDTGEELNRLLSIREILRGLGYEGILVKEHPDIPELSNEDKVRTFAGLCRFVLLENSFPAGQIAECKICSTNRIVTAALREDGRGSSFMVTDYFKDFDFMKEFTYEVDASSLAVSVQQAVDWAERKIKERREYFDSVYPWRIKPEN